jgi:ribonuclease Z
VIRNVDLLYHEATFIEEHRDRAQATKHSTAMDAASIAKEANVKKLILGHLSARYDSADQHEIESKQIFGNTEVVEDGNIYAI